ncbi:protein hunchback-like isoform X2 [Rhodnius prolixus]|uniref:protein hunchback-like isoform X2 n=1 Tax=Rhodnius prolixus TaxID=13249 RepID=UPI003D18CB20
MMADDSITSCDAMIVSADIFNTTAQSNTNMNCGLQYDSRHSVFPGLNMDTHWMAHHALTNVKQEPRDESEYGFGKGDKASFSSPLTPPGLNAAYSFPTPQSEYTGSSSPGPDTYSTKQTATNTTQCSGIVSDGSSGESAVSTDPIPTPKSDGGKSSPRLTPPGSIPSPLNHHHLHHVDHLEKHDNQDGGSQSSNSENEFYENGDSLRRLQMALQRTGMMPEEKLQCPMCEFNCNIRSQFNEHLMAHETKCNMCDFNGESCDKLREHMKVVHDCDEDMWGDDEPGLNTPKVNSQGKVKTFRCKQCEFSAVTKLEFWEHSRSHIKQERLLTCPKCPFVTEYKHHLEYHLRNHFGSKPFKCDKCSYSCVNKSMLNSHLKSHSNVYQFRCSDCTYATKYCHSLKLHLRKYGHSPAMVLNPDGSPNPLPIVDVYGTRRGPKQKSKHDKQRSTSPQQSQSQQRSQQSSPQPQQQQSQQQQQVAAAMPLFNPYSLLPTQMPYYNILNGFSPFPFAQDMRVDEKNNNIEKENSTDASDLSSPSKEETKTPLDLTCTEQRMDDTPPETPVLKNRRKGKAFKLERIAIRLQQHSEDEEPEQLITKPDIYVEPQPCKSPDIKSCDGDSEQHPAQQPQKPDFQNKVDDYNCSYCDISFKDIVMYTMHMGYHGYQDPFTCNMCGQQTTDKVAFFLHIARTSHS